MTIIYKNYPRVGIRLLYRGIQSCIVCKGAADRRVNIETTPFRERDEAVYSCKCHSNEEILNALYCKLSISEELRLIRRDLRLLARRLKREYGL